MFWCQDLEQDRFSKRNNFLRAVSVTRCPELCNATRSSCVSRDTKNPEYQTIHGQIAELGVTRVLWRFCVSYRRALSCSPTVRIAFSASPLLAELRRGVHSTATVSGIFAFTSSATAMIEGLSLHVDLFLFDAVARMQPVLESTMPENRRRLPDVASDISQYKIRGNVWLLATF